MFLIDIDNRENSKKRFLYTFIRIQPPYQVLKLTFILIKTLKLSYVTLYIKIVGFNILYQMNYTCICMLCLDYMYIMTNTMETDSTFKHFILTSFIEHTNCFKSVHSTILSVANTSVNAKICSRTLWPIKQTTEIPLKVWIAHKFLFYRI